MLCADGVGWGQFLHGSADGGLGREKKDAVNGYAKQSLILWIAGVAVGVVSSVLAVICVGIIVGIVGSLGLLVFNVMGLINAVKGQMKPLPLIGKWGED